MGYITPETVQGLKGWYNEFVNWMLTSEKGIDEDMAHNNHGAWFDVQIVSAALFAIVQVEIYINFTKIRYYWNW